MSRAKRRIDFYLSEETIARLGDMARDLGFTTASGTGVRRGNISALLEAIGSGKVVATATFLGDADAVTIRDVLARTLAEAHRLNEDTARMLDELGKRKAE
jgi:hypothetical protein